MAYSPQVKNKISANGVNSRASATLAAGATFQGTSEDVSSYGRAGIAITSSNATDGTLTVEVSHDGVTWGGPSRTWSDTRYAQPHMWSIVEQYFRIKCVNGTTEATDLAIQVHYSVNNDIFLGHQLNETFLDETEAIATKSVLVGKDSDGVYTNIIATPDGAVKTSIVSSLINFVHDYYVKVNASSTTDRYDYYTGGSGGTKVAEILVTYETTAKSEVTSAGLTLI